MNFVRIRDLVGRDDPVILDIGSNDGMHTNRFLKTFAHATVYAFEPDIRAISKWRRNVTDPRATLFECALGAESGEAVFHVSSGRRPGGENDPDYARGWDQSGSLRAPKTHLEVWPWVKFEETATVSVTTLDDWAGAHGIEQVDFIWADVQGAEGDLIAGASETLKRTRYLYTEYSNKEWYEGQVTLSGIADLLGADFEIAERWPVDVLFRNSALA